MDIQNLANECYKFGTGFCIVSNGLQNDIVNGLHDTLLTMSDNVMVLNANVPNDQFPDIDLKYDVVIFPEYNSKLFIELCKHNANKIFNIELATCRTMLFIPSLSDETHNGMYDRFVKPNRLLIDVHKWDNNKFVAERPDNTIIQPLDDLIIRMPELDTMINKRTITKAVYAGPNKNMGSVALEQFKKGFDFVRQQFIDGSSFIVFFDADESMDRGRVYRLLRIVKKCEMIVPNKSFLLLTSSLNADEHLKKLFYCIDEQFLNCLEVWPVCKFELITRHNLHKLLSELKSTNIVDEYDFTPKPKKFLCYNRVPRTARRLIVSYLHKNGLENDGYISLYDQENMLSNVKDASLDWANSMCKNKDVSELHNYFWDAVYPKLPIEHSCTQQRWNPVDVIPSDFSDFTDTYFSIVNETYFYNRNDSDTSMPAEMTTDAIFFSEKIFKPIIMKHPFIIVGRPHSLKYLRMLGYETMHPCINEDYDLEEDNDKRLLMILHEISRLCKLTDKQWKNIYKELQPRLNHNFEMLARPRNVRLKNTNFFKRFRDFELDSLDSLSGNEVSVSTSK